MFLQLVILGLLGSSEVMAKQPNVWPLGNVSLYNDVMGGANIRSDLTKTCFTFIDGPPVLSYSVLRLDEEPEQCYDVTLDGDSPLQDLTISFYVYPENEVSEISGTLLHYQFEEREILKIRTLANTFLVSFRDEYGMSAGTMYIVNFLTSQQWNHVTVSRHYETGRIVVFKDGVEMYNDDDEFSDVISFPNAGKLRIGKSLDQDDQDNFDGQFACVQLYLKVVSEADFIDLNEHCQPIKWKNVFNYYYKTVDGEECLTDPPIPPESYVSSVVTMTTLTSQSQWLAFLQKYGFQDSGRTSGYWSRKFVNKIPEINDDFIGSFNTTNKKICARLCMRVDSCMSFFVGANLYDPELKECILYDSFQSTLVDNSGSEYFEIYE